MRPQAFSLFRASNGLGYVEVYPKPQDLNPKFRVCCGLGFKVHPGFMFLSTVAAKPTRARSGPLVPVSGVVSLQKNHVS